MALTMRVTRRTPSRDCSMALGISGQRKSRSARRQGDPPGRLDPSSGVGGAFLDRVEQALAGLEQEQMILGKGLLEEDGCCPRCIGRGC